MSSRSGEAPRGVLRDTVVTGVSLGVAFALIDLWQVALVSPASLQPSGIAWLFGLYSVTALGGAFVLFGALRLLGADAYARRVPVAQAFLFAAGCFMLAQEVALRALEPLSPWRTWAVLGVLAGALVLWVIVAALLRVTRLPLGLAAAAALLLAVGGSYGAVRGFGSSGQVPTTTAQGPVAAGAERPNVVFILIDTLRADHLGAYGYARPTSPMLDGFAKESVLFENAFSQSSWTKPATASLLTSRYPSQHQCFLEKQTLPPSETTLPQYLQRAGYTTAMLSGNPWVTPDYGFDRGTNYFFSAYDERFARVTLYMMALKRLSKLVDAKARPYNRLKLLVQGEMSSEERDQVLTKEAVRWLEQNGTQEPFFLYLHFMSPHHPYEGVAPYDKFVPDPSLKPVTYYPKKSYFFFETGDELPAPQLNDMVARYDGDILHIDGLVGKLLGKLRELKLTDDTLVVVTSDHGEEFYDHRNWGHGQSIYNELIHVPLMIRFPAHFPAGKRVTEPVQTIDVLPTLLELAGAPLPTDIAGKTLLPVLKGDDASPRQAYSELLYRYGDSRSLVRGGSKLMRTKKGEEVREEVFDLGADPKEQQDVMAASPASPELKEKLTSVQAWAEDNKGAGEADAGAMTEEQKERLRQLGYLND